MINDRIIGFITRLMRFSYTRCSITVSDLIDSSDRDLLCKLCLAEHSLLQLRLRCERAMISKTAVTHVN